MPAATKVAKKIANSDTAKQMGNLLAEKGIEAATDLIGNAFGGDVSADTNIGNLQKKFVKNLFFIIQYLVQRNMRHNS